MAYTSTDLANVEAAVIELATGTRKVSVLINGKRIEYAHAELRDLEDLRDKIQAEVSSAAGRRRSIVVSTSKGL